MSSPSQTDADIHCEVCGEPTRVPGYGQQYGTLEAHWGYGSNHDGDYYRVRLCEPCFFATLAYLRQERRINRLFDDDTPVDNPSFGQVARDDWFGES
ncbi:MAG: hypothetical protein JL55_32510 [Pseudomonas sp. BICA1-14]|nr:hypothetical protein [[Pseudomonas] sp. BICA1-14]KJS70090.1 MAG: hypothetical protein JL55_32510 [[Pseudomonas] sp. BICA1-14]